MAVAEVTVAATGYGVLDVPPTVSDSSVCQRLRIGMTATNTESIEAISIYVFQELVATETQHGTTLQNGYVFLIRRSIPFFIIY